MPHYVYSTHTNNTDYVEYLKSTSAPHSIVKKRITINGGHGMCNKVLVTPQGVVTRIDKDEDMDWLNNLPSFIKDIERGYIRVSKSKQESEKIVKKDMATRDGSAPIIPTDYRPSGSGRFTYTKPVPSGDNYA